MFSGWFSRGDIDGFFGLFIDNLLQLMLIDVLCTGVCGLPQELVVGKILPGAAISILAGNLFYSIQAMLLARRTGRGDVTALPYGINTVSLIAFATLVIAPVYQQTHDATLAWRVGLFAAMLSAIIEIVGAFFADWLRRHTPMAAMLSALAGVAMTFIAMGFVFQVFANPLLAILPMMLILACYGGRLKLPLGIPGGLAAVLLGMGIAWGSRAVGLHWFEPAAVLAKPFVHWPRFVFHDAFALMTGKAGWRYLAVILPMSLFNIIGSLQNLASAEAAGDCYATRPSLLANGICGLLAPLLGSAFPTTIYIGHPGWKAMGARTGYSLLNGIAIAALCITGSVGWVLHVVPLEVTLGILVWIGIVMTAQAFADSPREHAPAVALGLLPAIAAWVLFVIEQTLNAAGRSWNDVLPHFGASLYIQGIVALNQGFLLSSMILAALLATAIDRQFRRAAFWSLAAAVLSMIGLIHAYRLGPGGIESHFGFAAAPTFAAAYAATALVMWGLDRLQAPKPLPAKVVPTPPIAAPEEQTPVTEPEPAHVGPVAS